MDKDKLLIVKMWFKKAESDLKTIRNNIESRDIPIDAVCFHAQQAIEKYIKGALVYYGENISKTHDLVHLLTLISKHIPELKIYENEFDEISHYGVEARYPDMCFDIPLEDAEKAYQISLKVKEIVLSKLKLDN